MKTLADVPVTLVGEAQQAALMRVQLYGVMETHRALGELGSRTQKALLDAAGADGKLDGLGLHLAQREIEATWKETFGEWVRLFEALRWEAAGIPFGTLAVYHEAYLGGLASEPVNESVRWIGEQLCEQFEEQIGAGMVGGGWYYEQLQVLLDAANSRVYEDGLNLSQRIWRLDKQSREGIMRFVYEGIASGNSAWNMAQKVEQYLGAGKNCPQWAWERLFTLTKQDIASGDRTGLFSGDACAGQGVAYNALRLMRNEIQAIHHLGTDMVLGRMPWVEKEEINLSPSHPDIGCECEDVVIQGEDGTGVYPKGTITLPIHVQCLCFKTAVLMDPDEFTRQARGWMTGTEAWGAMDEYATWLGVSATDLVQGGMAAALTATEARAQIEQVSAEALTEMTTLETQKDDLLSQARAASQAGDWKLARDLYKQTDDLFQRIRRLKDGLRGQWMDVLAVGNPAQFEANMSRVKAERKKIWKEGVEAFRRLVGTGTLDSLTVKVRAGGKGRSYYSVGEGQINMTTSAGVRAVVHELGHWLEDTDPAVLEKALAFYDRRTDGEDPAWLGDHYRRSERARRDQFLNSYMGKVYSSKGKRYATELVSMGLEMFFDDPAKLAQEDPDYFDFIYELVRGL